MSVLIKGMEMPTKCGECPCYYAEFNECNAIIGRWVDGKGTPPGDCPLIPVPPHGRLIDADALEYHADNVRDPMGRTEKTVMWKKIEAAPTIIPADGTDGAE